MPSKIKYCRFYDCKSNSNQNTLDASSKTFDDDYKKSQRKLNKVNERYHEKTSCRYLTMDTFFCIENVCLVFLCWYQWNCKDSLFTKFFPLWTIGLFLLALLCRFLYYQQHSWPVEVDEPIIFIKEKFCSKPKNNVVGTHGPTMQKEGNIN